MIFIVANNSAVAQYHVRTMRLSQGQWCLVCRPSDLLGCRNGSHVFVTESAFHMPDFSEIMAIIRQQDLIMWTETDFGRERRATEILSDRRDRHPV